MTMLKKFDTIKNCLVKCQIDNSFIRGCDWGWGLVPRSPKKGNLDLLSTDSSEEEIIFREVIPVPVSLWEEA